MFGTGGSTTTTPPEMSIDSHHWNGIVLEDNRRVAEEIDWRDTPNAYRTIITDSADADERLERRDELDEFVRETDFEESYLLIIVAGYWSSDYELAVNEVSRTETGLNVSLETVAPTGGQVDDEAPYSVVLRVKDERDVIPDEVTVQVDGERAGTTGID